MLNSLRNRIILAFGLIIILAIIVSTLVAIWSAGHQLEEFVSDISLKQATGLAGIVEVEYNLNGNLDSLSTRLNKQSQVQSRNESSLPGYNSEMWRAVVMKYGFSNERAVSKIMRSETKHFADSTDFSDVLERWYQAKAFVYRNSSTSDIRFDKSAVYLMNSNFTIRYIREHRGEREERHSEEGHHHREEHHSEEHHSSIPFYDWFRGDLVGYIVTEGRDEYSHESSEFTQGTFANNLYGGLITALFAFGIGIWLANRINSPVKALTQAATRLAESGDTEHIEVQSDDELGKMSVAFNRMADVIDAQQKVRQQLIADISHELNTPLSIMRLEAQGMVDGMQTPEEAAANIQREIDLLYGLITDLELIAEAEQKTIQLIKEHVAVADFLTEVIERWQARASTQDIELQLILESFPATVVFDRNRMLQVLGNLLRNALQDTERGGQITVTANADPTHFTSSIKDNGHGIAAEHLPRLFERFYRFADGDKRISSGRGLGLAIVKQLVELHEGQVKVTSEFGVGSTFVISIPLSVQA